MLGCGLVQKSVKSVIFHPHHKSPKSTIFYIIHGWRSSWARARGKILGIEDHGLHGLSDRADAWTGLLDGSGRRCSVREFLSHSSLGLTSIDGRIQSRHVRTVSDRESGQGVMARPQTRPRHAHHGTLVLPRASRAHPAVRRYAGSHQTTPGRRSTVIRAKVAGEARSGRGGDSARPDRARLPAHRTR